MLRRLAFTAVASFAALSAVPSAASATGPLPLPLGLLQSPDRLTVAVAETGNPRADGSYELRCGPAGGTHPEAQRACDRLEELAAEGKDPFAPASADQMCTQMYGGPATARVSGTWRGRQVDVTFDRRNGCGVSRWNDMEPVLPSARS
ncbi:subtilase-type protease inhibitor [Streptomyces sp. A3M-1-3]|uniref:SSI family serine proteinase inhibitor n=1 Tax=Streptomyces sp. A3M-1-3 TaxID=2962044 RepID=UPI0020B77710|nr:SSI family serine proteinase inhibitor [Streptomyces sp. A3M-1-3]MCP3818021.1 subtilase-type protease inhibitor [Streptomyces sp. A3M-1-3]